MVTHDRYLVDKLATQIWELRDGRLRVHKGGYASYLEARRQSEEQAKAQQSASRAKIAFNAGSSQASRH